MVDMLVRLYALPSGEAPRLALQEQGVQIRSCRPYEMHAVEAWIARTFSTRWVSEFQIAMSHQPCGCIIDVLSLNAELPTSSFPILFDSATGTHVPS